MMEVACAVCGAVYRFAPTDIPPSGKTVTCAKCKARIVVAGSAAGGTGDTIDLADLPAPKRMPSPPPRPASPAGALMDGIDLPPPKGKPADPLTLDGIVDLPAPKGPPQAREPEPLTLDAIDLLAPVGPSSRHANAGPPSVGTPIDLDLGADLPAPKRKSDLPDLPAPKRKPELPDLPAPKRAAAAEVPDLPAPKRKPDLPDLPAPKRPGGGDLFDDLPAPKGPSLADMLPAPKGPSPSAGLPAPKGFFDDLPQPRAANPAPDLVAPKGFFDDLPQPGPLAGGSDRPLELSSADIELDALPGAPASTAFAPPPAVDLAPPSITSAARPGMLDLDGLELEAPTGSMELELEPAVASARQAAAPAAIAPRGSSSTAPPPLELGDGDALAGLDLPSPPSSSMAAPRPGGVVSFKAGAGGADPPSRDAGRGAAIDPGSIDLAGPTKREAAPKPAPRPAADKRAAPAPARSPRLVRILLAAGVLVAAGGAGGFYLYRRNQAAEQRQAEITRGLRTSRDALLAGDRPHWMRAVAAARGVLAVDHANDEAAGLVAQGLLAAYLDDGGDRDRRVKDARAVLDPVRGAAGKIAAVDKALALDLLVDGEAEAAATRLQALVGRNDADAVLYLGWAQLALGRWDAAIASFERAVKDTPKRTVPALYGLARAQLGKGDRATARATFLKVIEADQEHVGALVGEAEAMPADAFVEREGGVLAILQRKDIDKVDPRVVARAWTLAGDDARRAGRLDAARERYRKALALVPTDVPTLVSTAALELRDDKPDAAVETVDKALSLAPGDVGANLIAVELDLKRDKLAEAAARLTALRDRTPPLAGDALGRFHLLDGARLEAERQPDAALAAYDAAAAALGEGEVAPMIAAGKLLGDLAARADAAKKPDEAKALRARADEKLNKLAARAAEDPAVAIALGVAYLSAGVPVQSEAWLRTALERRPRDVEAHFQLAEALRRQGKQDEAVATLMKSFDLDPSRVDLGLELARGFEAAGRDADAATLYRRLLDGRDVAVDVRVRAGRFFARTKDLAAARAQGDAILAVEPDNAAGLFLKAEGLLADGLADEARRLFQQAVDRELDPQYSDGLGRAAEAQASKSGNPDHRDAALAAYVEASRQAPTMLSPILGRGRLHMARRELEKALAAYQEALKLAPNDPEIAYGVGMSLAELGDKDKAIVWLQKAVAARPRADAYYRLGLLHLDANQGRSAASALTAATQHGLKEEAATGRTLDWMIHAYYKLGDVQKMLGNDAAMIDAWQNFIARNPTDPVLKSQVQRELRLRDR